MMKRLVLFVVIFLLALNTGCSNNEYWENNYADEGYSEESYEDEAYVEDDEFYEEEAYYEDEAYSEDDDYYYEEESLLDSLINIWLYDTAEDCYEDEYFDEEEQLCLLLDENYDEYNEPSVIEELLTYVFTTIPEDNFEPYNVDSEEVAVSYVVNGDQLVIDPNADIYPEELEQHQQLWAYFTRLIPGDARPMVAQFGIASDGVDGTMAWVEPLENDLSEWILVVDPADASKPEELTFTLIHEYGHLLTLNQHQINVTAASCSTYEPQEGCSYENAYVNAFYEQFWTSLLPEIQEIEAEEDEDLYYEKLDEFYQYYADQFVSDYAATNIEEDMAESWSYFVLNYKPEGDSIAEQKILFYYDYPELVELRGEIVQRTNARLRRSNP